MLLIGGDGLIGASLAQKLRVRQHAVHATTRDPARTGPMRPFLDLASPDAFEVPASVDRVCILAAVTTFERCENDPEAQRINVEAIPRLARRLLKEGLHVTFLSTNAVFGGDRPWPAEDDPHEPRAAYSRQKSAAESAIREAARQLGAGNRAAVVRLTKVLGLASAPVHAWRQAWSGAQIVRPFSDLIFAPISLDYTADAMATLVETGPAGNFHLSGSQDLDYGQFARALAARLGVDAALVAPATSRELGATLAFTPRSSALAMTRTTRITGLLPQSLDAVIDDLAANRPASAIREASISHPD